MAEDWKVEAERIKVRDSMILMGMEAGIDDICEKQAQAMCHDNPGMVYPRLNRHVFAEVKACIVAACLAAIKRKAETPGQIHELTILRDPTRMMGAATCSCGKFARTFTIIDPKVEDHALAWLQNEHDKHTKAVP